MDLFDIAVASKLAGGGGGGGGSSFTKIAEKSLGHIETTSTSATDIDSMTIQRRDLADYDMIFIVSTTGVQETGKHCATITGSWVYSSRIPGCDGTMDCRHLNFFVDSNDYLESIAGSTTGHTCGVYAATSMSGDSVVIAFKTKYNASYSKTIDGDYTTTIYGVKLLDLI